MGVDLVYFVQAGDVHGPIKIGRTTNVNARISTMQSGCPLRLRHLLSIVQPNTYALEYAFHRLFADLRIDGLEWFTWHPHLQSAVDRWKAARVELLTGVEFIDRLERIHDDGAVQVETVTGIVLSAGMNWRLRDGIV